MGRKGTCSVNAETFERTLFRDELGSAFKMSTISEESR